MYSCKRKTCHHLFLLRFFLCFDFPTISKLIVRPWRQHVPRPRPPFLCPPLVGNFVSFDIRFQFSNVDRIGNFHHQSRPHSVQTCPQGRAGKRSGGGGRGLRNQSMSIFVLHARNVLSIISVKNAPAVKKASGGKEWQARLGCLLDA